MDLDPFDSRKRCARTPAQLLALVCLVLFCHVAQSQDSSTGYSRQVWLNAGTLSYHFNRDKDLREDNIGLGAELMLSERHAVAAGTFINSNRQRSRYGAYEWRPLHWDARGVKIYAGIAVGAFDGYPNYRNGAWFPAALPMLAVQGDRLGANIFIVPTIAKRLDGAIAVQFKLRVW